MIRVCQCIEDARKHEDVITLFEDEFTFYQSPTVANGWDIKGKTQPLVRWGYKGNKKRRIGGVINVVTGEVTFIHDTMFGIKELKKLCILIRKQYHKAKTINVIMDNWPVHYHPEVMQVATENNLRFISLPTYAPWTNPIEKLWRWLYQDILHHHRHANQWTLLIKMVSRFLKQFENGSEELIKYVGLSNGKIPAAPHDWKEISGYRENRQLINNETKYTEHYQEKLLV